MSTARNRKTPTAWTGRRLEQPTIQVLQGDPKMRMQFIHKLAAPVANKLFRRRMALRGRVEKCLRSTIFRDGRHLMTSCNVNWSSRSGP